MSGNRKGGNSSTSDSNTRTTPYNTRNNGKGGSYTSLNNPNDSYDGYETASSKKARRKEGQKPSYVPKNSQTVEPISKEILASAVEKVQDAMAVDNDSQERTIDNIQAELNAQLEDIAKQAKEDAEKCELMAAAVNDALGTTKPVTSPVTDKDDDLIMIDANPISHQNAEASGSGTNNPTDITPKDNTVITPISTEVKKTKTRTIINRSQRYRLYAPVTAFITEDITEIRKSLLHLYDKFYSLTDISVRSIKRQDKSVVKFIVEKFYVESKAKRLYLCQFQ